MLSRLRIEWFMAKNHWKDKLAFKVAWALPRWLVYFATIRLIAYATQQGRLSSTELGAVRAMDALKVWEKREADHA
jgi:hypothetical protein